MAANAPIRWTQQAEARSLKAIGRGVFVSSWRAAAAVSLGSALENGVILASPRRNTEKPTLGLSQLKHLLKGLKARKFLFPSLPTPQEVAVLLKACSKPAREAWGKPSSWQLLRRTPLTKEAGARIPGATQEGREEPGEEGWCPLEKKGAQCHQDRGESRTVPSDSNYPQRNTNT